MRTIVHLSDLHFGRTDPATLEPLRACLARLAPHLLVVSGDLTQRARPAQFRQARAYLDTLPGPQLVVPGNHDVPLYDLFSRFLSPFGRFRRLIGQDLQPVFVDDEIAVLGVNTARGLALRGGRVSKAQIAGLRAALRALDRRLTRILVSHHPFDVTAKGCGADVVLAGHLHAGYAGALGGVGVSAIVVQAGTATSRRTRGSPNSFNVLRVAPGHIEIDEYSLAREGFACSRRHVFDHASGVWVGSHGPA